MSLSPTSGQVVLKEVFDEASVPTDEEIYDYATRIGIDVENEPHLLYLARDGLMQALPSGWKPCYDKDKKEIYYFNFKTKKAQWEHPLDDVYRNLVKKARSESLFTEQIDDDSRTSIKEDLKSFEEASLILTANEMFTKPKKLEPLSPLGKGVIKKIPNALSPLKKSNSRDLLRDTIDKPALHLDEEKLFLKSEHDDFQKRLVFNDIEVRKRPNSSDIRNRRNIGPMEFGNLSKQEIIIPNALEKFSFLTESKKLLNNKISVESPSTEIKGNESGLVTKDEGYATEFSVSSVGEKDAVGKRELTLAGGGSVFLKANKLKSSPSSDLVTSSFSKEELSEGILPSDIKKYGNEIDSHPKSILRDQNSIHKVNNKPVAGLGENKIQKEELEDDRKSVRFNLEKELKNDSTSKKAVSFESSNIPYEKPEKKQKARQNELDFDDYDFVFSDEYIEKMKNEAEMNLVKTIEPKKFKPSQMLVKEYRKIFENQPEADVNSLRFSKIDEIKNSEIKSSHGSSNSSSSSSSSSSSRSALSPGEADSHLSQGERTPASNDKPDQTNQTQNLTELKIKESEGTKLSTSALDTALDELMDFAIKKKLDMHSPGEGKSQIHYQDKDFLLEEILKANDSDSLGESEGDKLLSDGKELEFLEKLESHISLKAQKRRELEEDFGNYEKMKNEKLNELEREYKIWLEDMEDLYKKKRREASDKFREKFEIWMKERESEFEKSYQEKYEKETQNRFKELENEFLKMEEEKTEKLKNELHLQEKERLNKLRFEIEAQGAKELDDLRKSCAENLSDKKMELMKKHKNELEKIEGNLTDLLSEQKSQKLKELELARENESMIEVMRLEMKESYQKQKNNLMKEHELLLENLKREQALAIEQLKIDFKNEEESVRKAHLNILEEIKKGSEIIQEKKSSNTPETPRPSDNTETRVFEKVRCEKRLLEDKYKTLKEKYIRLKTEAKSTLERKKKKKEISTATGSETEQSFSSKFSAGHGRHQCDSPHSKTEGNKNFKLKKQINQLEHLYNDISTEDEENLMSSKKLSQFQKCPDSVKSESKNDEKKTKSVNGEKLREESSGEEKKLEGCETKKKRQLFSRFKAASTSRINSNGKSQEKEVLSPVENLRRQLKKLEELEDQFPVTTYTDTYMRYPFTDNAHFGSSEIEFFKHRIHLERESVRRAKDSLKAQKKSFENRQRELKQKLVEGEPGCKAVIDQIYQEEKELTDMEVSVYRTRALLGEKIIRLRHLEQSLKRISQPMKKDLFAMKGRDLLGRLGVRHQSKEDDKTLSDLSSYSGSSGFSSTDFNDSHTGNVGCVKNTVLMQNRRHFQNNMRESSEIIQSLENLNAEIREIWEVLKKQQSSQETITMLPPPPLIYGDLGWSNFNISSSLPFRNTVITSTANLQRPVAQQFKTQVAGNTNLSHVSTIIESSLLDKTRSLRDWLKAARNSTPPEVIGPTQVTL